MWQRFDKFNEKYEPFGVKIFREIFLKHDNFVEGRFLADITREVIDGSVTNSHDYLEPRLSIYGRSENEWDALASWVVRYNLVSKRVKWMVQIPRIFRKIAEALASKDASASSQYSFQTLLCNIFKPLFEVTLNPQSHPDLHKVINFQPLLFSEVIDLFLQFLLHMSGFDCVDDESASEADFSTTHPLPSEVTLEYLQKTPQNPLSFNYYMYYLWANINVLNQLRVSRDLAPLSFRPHAGEAGPLDHLAGAYLVSDGIAHGINLRLSPVLQSAALFESFTYRSHIFCLLHVPLLLVTSWNRRFPSQQ